jgi:hypothetical protein
MSGFQADKGRHLAEHLFRGRTDLGKVLSGPRTLYVRIYGSWRGPRLTQWEGMDVDWQTQCGTPREELTSAPATQGWSS